jgi:hypothetical protein
MGISGLAYFQRVKKSLIANTGFDRVPLQGISASKAEQLG